MIEFYIDIRVVLILVFAHGPLPLRTLPCQGIAYHLQIDGSTEIIN